MAVNYFNSEIYYFNKVEEIQIQIFSEYFKVKFGLKILEFWEEKSPNSDTFMQKAKYSSGDEVEFELKFAVWDVLNKFQADNIY